MLSLPSNIMWTECPFSWTIESPHADIEALDPFEDNYLDGDLGPLPINDDNSTASAISHLPTLGGDHGLGGLDWDFTDVPELYDGLSTELIGASPVVFHPHQVDDIWRSVNRFFDAAWFIFPLISYETIQSRLTSQNTWSADPQFRTLLLAIRLANATIEYRMTSANSTILIDLIREVERSRLDFDFAEPPTLDDVLASTVLFVAFNVLEKHGRAFLYLDEAFSLSEGVEAIGEHERLRQQVIQQILYNTEAASAAIYAPATRLRKAKKPTKLLDLLP